MSIGAKSDFSNITRDLGIYKDKLKQAAVSAMTEMRDAVAEEVVDNKNWNPEAVYKGGPQEGQKYDLKFTGRLLETIRNPNLNTVRIESHSIIAGVGHTESLDSIPTMRGKNPHGGYWRQVVFGRAAIPGYIFYSDGSSWEINPLKTKGWAVKSSKGKIDSSEPTYMFERGFTASIVKRVQILRKYFGGTTR